MPDALSVRAVAVSAQLQDLHQHGAHAIIINHACDTWQRTGQLTDAPASTAPVQPPATTGAVVAAGKPKQRGTAVPVESNRTGIEISMAELGSRAITSSPTVTVAVRPAYIPEETSENHYEIISRCSFVVCRTSLKLPSALSFHIVGTMASKRKALEEPQVMRFCGQPLFVSLLVCGMKGMLAYSNECLQYFLH